MTMMFTSCTNQIDNPAPSPTLPKSYNLIADEYKEILLDPDLEAKFTSIIQDQGEDGPDRRARMVQWRQLRDHILAHLDNRPVIVTGDLNSYYERGGKFPAMVEGPVTNDPGSTTWALKGQTLDKIIYINPTGGPQLKPLSFAVDSATYVRPDGKTPLGDHAPVSAKFRFLPR